MLLNVKMKRCVLTKKIKGNDKKYRLIFYKCPLPNR